MEKNIFTLREDINKDQHELEPIRGSVIILIIKLSVALFLFELIYGIIYYVLSLGIPLPFDLHHHVAEAIFILGIFKLFAEIIFIVYIALSWTNNMYFLTEKHIIQRKGILHVEEDIFHFNNIRSISINQSIFGKIFRYGDIMLKTSASGGYQGDVSMTGIANPEKYEKMISNYF